MRALRLGWTLLAVAFAQACQCDRPQLACQADLDCPGTYSCVAGVCAKCPACGANEHCAAGACVPNANANRLVFTSAPQTVAAGTCSGAVTVSAQDQNGAPAPPAADVAVALASSSGSMAFFSDDACAVPVSQLTIAAGAPGLGFRFRDDAAGMPELSAAASGYDTARQVQTVTAGMPVSLAITTAPQTVVAGACSAAVSVAARDQLGNPAPVAADTALGLTSSSATLAFFADAACGTPVTSLPLTAGMASRDVFFRDTAVGTPQLTVTATFGVATQVETITPSPATALAFTSPARTILTGGCSGALTVQVQDALGNASVAMMPVPLMLASSSSTMVFHLDAACTSPSAAVMVPSGSSSASFYFTDSTAGAPGVTASAAGLSSAVQNQTVNAAAGKLAFVSGAQVRAAGACSGAVTVQTQTPAGVAQSVAAPTPVSLGTLSATLRFFSDAMCMTPITSVTVATGTDSALFHFSDTSVGTQRITADAQDYTQAVQDETITAGPPTRLVFTSAAQTRPVGGCSAAVDVETRDAANNPAPVTAATVLMLASTSVTMTFHTDSSCSSAAVTGVTLAAGTSTAPRFYFKDTVAGTRTVTVSGGTLQPATQVETIATGGVAKLAIVTPARTVTAGACSAVLTVQSQDAFSNPTAVTALTTVALSSSSTTLRFFSDAACNTMITSVDLAMGMNSAGFYVRDTKANAATPITASAGALTPATQNVNFVAGAPHHLAFTTAAQMVPDASCSAAATVQLQDLNNNPVNAAMPLVLALTSSSATMGFFPDGSCGAAVTMVTLAQGMSTVNVHFRDTTVGMVTITAAATGLMPATQTQTITMVTKRLAFTTAALTVAAGACGGPVTVQSQNQVGAPLAVTMPTPVTFTTTPAGTLFFSNSTCTMSGTPTIAMGASSVTVYFKETRAGAFNLTADSTGYGNVTQTEMITAGPVFKVGFAAPAATVAVNTCSPAVTVETQDQYGNFVRVSGNTPATVTTSSATMTLYSNATCGTVQSSGLNLSNGQRIIYFRDTTVGMPVLTAMSAGLMSGTQAQTVTAGPVTKMAFVTPPRTGVTAGACSPAVTIGLQDAFNNAAPAAAATTVMLSSPSTTLSLFSDVSCTMAASSLTIAQGMTSASFYFRDTKAETARINATSAPLAAIFQDQGVVAGQPSRLAFVTGSQSLAAGACSGLVTVQVQDQFGNVAQVGANTVLNLSGDTPSVTLYSDACVTVASQVTILSGMSQQSFRFRETRAGTTNLSVSAMSLGAPAPQPQTIAPGVASRLVFTTAPVTVKESVCTPTALRLQTQDGFGNAAAPATALNIGLSSGSATMEFFDMAACTAAVTSVNLPVGTSTVDFWLRDPTVGTPVITANGGATVGSAMQTATIDPAVPTKLAFITPARTVAAGACSAALTVQSQNVNGLPSAVLSDTTVNLTSGSGGFYSDAACTVPVSQVVIAGGTNSQSFYFRDTTTGMRTVSVSASMLAGAMQTQDVVAGPPSRLVVTTPQRSSSAGACSLVVTLQVRDAFGNDTTMTANATVDLASSPAGLSFYTDSTCGTPPQTSVVITSGLGAVSFYARSNTANGYTINATSSPLTPASQLFTVTAGTASVLAFTTAPRTVVAGACSPVVSFSTRDAFNNDSNVGAPLQVGLAGPAGMTFYSDAACTNQLTMGVTVPMGSNTASFFFQDTVTGARVLALSATGFTGTNQTQTVTAGPPARLLLAGAGQTVLASACSAAVTVQSQDAFMNPTSAAVTVDLAASSTPPAVAAGLTFYSDASCTMAVTQVTISAGSSQRTFFFRAITGGSVTVNATSGTLTPAAQVETITPTVRTGTCGLANGVGSFTCSIPSPALGATTRTMMLFQASSNGSAGADANVRCTLASPSSIVCDRAGNTGAVSIQWQTVEFPPGGPTVRHVTAACGGSLTTVNFAPAVAQLSDSFVLFSSTRSSNTGQTVHSTRTAKLASLSQVTVEHNSGGCGGDGFAVQVVEYPGAVVTNGTTPVNALSTTLTVNPAIDPARTFLLYSWRSAAGLGCARLLRGAVGANNVTFTRGVGNASCNGTAIDELAFQRVQLPVGNVVQAAPVSLAAAVASGSATLTTAVDLTRSIAFSGGEITSGQAGGESGFASGEVFGEALGRHVLTAATTVQVSRDSSQGAATFGAFVIELRP